MSKTIKKTPEVFIGITTWNSELFLPFCLESIKKTLPEAEVVILDNVSIDETQAIAKKFNTRLIVKRCGQAEALNMLASSSRSPYTVLIHADVVFLSNQWASRCISKLTDEIVLVSPEDIGCGPYTRPWGKNKPESSFMFFKTECFKNISISRRYQRFKIPYYKRVIDFYGDHITYNIPESLESSSLSWHPMKVHVSDYIDHPYYIPPFEPRHWRDDLAHLRYGLGNFYSLDGEIMHYHNWYDRVPKIIDISSTETADKNGNGVPSTYVSLYTKRFLEDYHNNAIVYPQ
ncbi:glycosyltransferase [Pseudanabaena mucicola]|uniref:4,4'-diaponeurosporenoate glycosyltransferase n=1 Tax=Pseudanabaena mucicola FACHB-723 TaxID=2692860 RepID=A0ABR7ZTI3_9CYAN|nr:glycosyltransferase [Pseudanabaena mucicola]MBD2187094.1 glycosyltransferase family 2 protein [Pseudanabaena mucicola FACHB-723]